jgi:hypothetical protein
LLKLSKQSIKIAAAYSKRTFTTVLHRCLKRKNINLSQIKLPSSTAKTDKKLYMQQRHFLQGDTYIHTGSPKTPSKDLTEGVNKKTERGRGGGEE